MAATVRTMPPMTADKMIINGRLSENGRRDTVNARPGIELVLGLVSHFVIEQN